MIPTTTQSFMLMTLQVINELIEQKKISGKTLVKLYMKYQAERLDRQKHLEKEAFIYQDQSPIFLHKARYTVDEYNREGLLDVLDVLIFEQKIIERNEMYQVLNRRFRDMVKDLKASTGADIKITKGKVIAFTDK